MAVSSSLARSATAVVKSEPAHGNSIGDTAAAQADLKSDATAKSELNAVSTEAGGGRLSTDSLVQPKEENHGGDHGSNSSRSKSEEAYTLFFGSSNWYLFLRLHAILCDRLYNMYEQSQILLGEEVCHRNNRRDSTATALRLKPKSDVKIEDYYPTFVEMLKNVLDGNMDTTNFEDSLREMFGIHAYMAFTLDRVSFECG